MLDILAQIGVTVLTTLSILMVSSLSPAKRMKAGLLGIASGPCYLFTVIVNGQWLMLPAIAVCTYSWWRVYVNNRNAQRFVGI